MRRNVRTNEIHSNATVENWLICLHCSVFSSSVCGKVFRSQFTTHKTIFIYKNCVRFTLSNSPILSFLAIIFEKRSASGTKPKEKIKSNESTVNPICFLHFQKSNSVFLNYFCISIYYICSMKIRICQLSSNIIYEFILFRTKSLQTLNLWGIPQ